MKTLHQKVEIPGRESLELTYSLSEDQKIKDWSLKALGDLDFLLEIEEIRHQKLDILNDLVIPMGDSKALMMWREIVLRAQGHWNYPYEEEELCHCRAVPCQVVDQSILGGAATPEEVSQQTSASTACGTCRVHVEKILKYRKGET